MSPELGTPPLPRMLEKFRQAKAEEIATLELLREQGKLPLLWEGARVPFLPALEQAPGGLAVIAEYKRASPSKGLINDRFGPEDIARAYAEGGATALSVLTEARFFQGDLGFLERMHGAGLPLLRKDFILHPLQVLHTAATPASALLLIVRMLDDALLGELLHLARNLGLEAVVEAFDEADVLRAQEMGARIIQINNRDLDTLRTDLEVSARLVRHKREGELWVSASGLAVPEDLARMRDLGYGAVLVGTSLMATPAPGEALRALCKGVRP